MGFPMYCFPRKVFVKGGGISEDAERTETSNPVQTLTGDSARNFYESVVNDGPAASSRLPSKPKNTDTRSLSRNRTHSYKLTASVRDIWKLAQNNDYVSLEILLRETKNSIIDCTDDFGWTPLMCASCSGAKESVEILIKNKADPNVSDKSGNTALSLAKKNKFSDIVKILKNQKLVIGQAEKEVPKKEVEAIFCKTCNGAFHTDLKNHECSTLHLFNNGSGQSKIFYGIPESNKGFQMLLRNGWNKEKGLGPNESGIHFPIKAHKKKDRIGFGGAIPKNDINEGNNNITKKHKGFKTEKYWKNFERNFRLEFQ